MMVDEPVGPELFLGGLAISHDNEFQVRLP